VENVDGDGNVMNRTQIELVVSERISGAAGGQNNMFQRIMQDSVEAEIAQAMAAGRYTL
jgi:hypothetical protein